MNNKGSLIDAIYVPAYLLGVAITIVLAGFIWLNISSVMEPAMNSTVPDIGNSIDIISEGFSAMDYMFPFIVGGLLIISLIFAFNAGAGVIYGILSFLFWIFAIFMSLIFTNIFGEFANAFPTITIDYPIIYYILINLKWVVLGWVFLISVVMFTRNKREDDSVRFQEAQYGYGGYQ